MKKYWKGYRLYIITNMFWHKSFQNICLMCNSARAAEQDEKNYNEQMRKELLSVKSLDIKNVKVPSVQFSGEQYVYSFCPSVTNGNFLAFSEDFSI